MSANVFTALGFPLVVSAQSERRAAIVCVDRPLSAPVRFTMRPDTMARTHANIATLFQPAALLHVNGTRWQMEVPPLSPKGVLALTVRSACEFLGIAPSRVPIVERLLDAYPELEPRLMPIKQARFRTDRVRAAQPLVAAMIVAHAASVAHLMKHG